MIPVLVGSLSSSDITRIEFIVVGVAAFILFVVAARIAAHLIGQQLSRRNVRADMVVLGRRVVTVLVIAVGILAALGFATQTANITLVGILLATVIAALGVQDLLRDYVSGYYILLERHFRVGDRIGFDDNVGTVGDVRLRVTLVRTDDGHLVVIPNSELFTKAVTVYARPAVEPAPKAVEPPTKSDPPK
jgi:small conductance mechanosensitive channel